MKDYNSTIQYFRAPFLVREWKTPITKRHRTSNSTLRIDKNNVFSRRYKNADIMIFNTAHWWTHEKTSLGYYILLPFISFITTRKQTFAHNQVPSLTLWWNSWLKNPWQLLKKITTVFGVCLFSCSELLAFILSFLVSFRVVKLQEGLLSRRADCT